MAKTHADARLIEAAKRRPEAFEELYAKYKDNIHTFVWYRSGHDQSIAEDLTQEVFFLAFRALKTYQEKGYSYQAFLLSIARNLLKNYYRKNKPVQIERMEDLPLAFFDDTAAHLELKDLWKAVNESLTESEQEAILLRYQKELSIREVSHVMKRSENAVKLLLSRSRKKLRKHGTVAMLKNLPRCSHTVERPKFVGMPTR